MHHVTYGIVTWYNSIGLPERLTDGEKEKWRMGGKDGNSCHRGIGGRGRKTAVDWRPIEYDMTLAKMHSINLDVRGAPS